MNQFPMLLAQAAGGSSPAVTGLMLLAMVAAMYFLLIRPQQKQAAQHRDLVSGLKKGDEVVTSGGLMGRIHEVREKTLMLEVATGVRVRVLKTAVQGKGTLGDDAVTKEPEDKKEEK